MPKKSHIRINVKCDICGKEKQLKYEKYIKNTKDLTQPYCCCRKCAEYKIKKTSLEKHGNENYKNIKLAQQTNLSKYGVENPFQNKEIKEKIKQEMLKKYGCVSPMCNSLILEKSKKTCLIKYGFENVFQNKNIKEKSKKTMLRKYGVEHALQDPDIFKKSKIASFETIPYKNTDLTYQAGYEKYFLELMDKHGFINELSMGKLYNYTFSGKQHVYHSDYLFRGTTIEIKSTWTYNLNGKDVTKGLQNEAKWKAVRDIGDSIVVLKSKNKIKNYIKKLTAIIY